MKHRLFVVATVVVSLWGLSSAALADHLSFWGRATYYAHRYVGQTMACGGRYRHRKMIAAVDLDLDIPCGKELRVKNRDSGKIVTVTVKDRCACHGRVVVDLSRRAARKLGYLRAGWARVKVTRLHSHSGA